VPVIPSRISVVTLGVQDLERMCAFYEALGWPRADVDDDDVAFFLTGPTVLALFRHHLLVADAGLDPTDPPAGFRGLSLAVNVETPEGVAEAIEAVRGAGGTILKEPVDAEWGGRTAYFADPEGHAWEVAWLPGSSFDERGGLIPPWRPRE
jgi:uncharacterized protein